MTNAMTAALPPVPTCIVIYTDGSCQPNPGPGGYAAILCHYSNGNLEQRRRVTGGATATTNIRMEMSAVIAALEAIDRDDPHPIFIFTDNEMIVKGMTEWMPGWIAKGWRNGKGKRVENVDLWQEIVRLGCGLNVTFRWVRGHSGDPMNDEVDQLAAKERDNWVRQHCRELFGDAA